MVKMRQIFIWIICRIITCKMKFERSKIELMAVVATIFIKSSLFVSFSKLLFTLESDFGVNSSRSLVDSKNQSELIN